MYYGLDAEYVMDKISFYEISALMDYGYLKHRSEYECARLGAYVTAQCHSKKPLQPTDIVKFEWENKKEKVEFDEEQVKALMERANNFKPKITNPKF